MKKLLVMLLIMAGTTSIAQNENFPDITLKTPDGKTVSAQEIQNDGKPIVISFWATWCKPCLRELSAMNELLIDWQEETGVRLIAISIDDARNSGRVGPFVKSQNWDFDVLIDENSELRRQLGVNNIPHTFLLDNNGKIVWQHNGYNTGDEYHLYELIEKVAKGKKID